jgi:hypothetical protein
MQRLLALAERSHPFAVQICLDRGFDLMNESLFFHR